MTIEKSILPLQLSYHKDNTFAATLLVTMTTDYSLNIQSTLEFRYSKQLKQLSHTETIEMIKLKIMMLSARYFLIDFILYHNIFTCTWKLLQLKSLNNVITCHAAGQASIRGRFYG